MKNISVLSTLLLSASLLFTCFAPSAFAADPAKLMCLKSANQDYRKALSDARTDLNANSAICRYGPEIGSCMSGCFVTFKSCIQPAQEVLTVCRKSCAATELATRLAAKNTLGCGENCGTNADFQKAAIQARLAFHSCTITCRSDSDNIASRAACRTVMSACNRACRS